MEPLLIMAVMMKMIIMVQWKTFSSNIDSSNTLYSIVEQVQRVNTGSLNYLPLFTNKKPWFTRNKAILREKIKI